MPFFWEQEAQRLALGRELAVDLLCALANNNSRCYDESLEFAEHLERILPSADQVGAAFLCHLLSPPFLSRPFPCWEATQVVVAPQDCIMPL